MIINDRVYGKQEVTDEVLIELMNSKPLDRMKRVNQAGASVYVLPEIKVISRFEHCVGAMLLLRKLGTSLEEQIAGLLHDVPHTAFSHVSDYVFEDASHEYHERFFEKIIKNSEIPQILEKYGFDVNRVIDEKSFKHLEQDAPRLCADRCDYTLRDCMVNFPVSQEHYQRYADDFVSHKGRMMMNTPELAKEFMKLYLNIDRQAYAAPIEIAAFEVLANALKIAIKTGEMVEDDLFVDDDTAMAKLRASKNQEIHQWIDMLTPDFSVVKDKDNYDFFRKTKVRFIDPDVVMPDGSTKRVTELFPEMTEKLEAHKAQTEKGVYIRYT